MRFAMYSATLARNDKNQRGQREFFSQIDDADMTRSSEQLTLTPLIASKDRTTTCNCRVEQINS